MGALAGPVCIAVVAFPLNATKIPGVNDSKKLSKKKREALWPIIMREAAFVGVGWSHPSVIDNKGLAEAWNRAALDALEFLPHSVEELIIDGIRNVRNYSGKQSTLVKADALVWEVSAASIIAKVARDLDMKEMARSFDGYAWEKNSGYGSKVHMEAIQRLGPSPYHRLTFLK